MPEVPQTNLRREKKRREEKRETECHRKWDEEKKLPYRIASQWWLMLQPKAGKWIRNEK
jgi:hypothetical protein